jgi:hypothetical protein
MKKRGRRDEFSGPRACIGTPQLGDTMSTNFTASGTARPRGNPVDIWVCPLGRNPGDNPDDRMGNSAAVNSKDGTWTASVHDLDPNTNYTVFVTPAGSTTPILDAVQFTTGTTVCIASPNDGDKVDPSTTKTVTVSGTARPSGTLLDVWLCPPTSKPGVDPAVREGQDLLVGDDGSWGGLDIDITNLQAGILYNVCVTIADDTSIIDQVGFQVKSAHPRLGRKAGTASKAPAGKRPKRAPKK